MADISKFMTPRLFCVASFAKKGCAVADIGTDHAYIPIWLVQNGIAERAIAMDINRGPITRAEENIHKFSLEDKIKTRLSDGLEMLLPGEADTVIIAGMGGMLINEILERAKSLRNSVNHYILQPMTAIEETRKYLERSGFQIKDEKLAKEDSKLYCVMSVIPGHMKMEQEIDYHVGKKLIENKDPLLYDYLKGKIYEYDKAIASLQLSDGEKTADRAAHFAYLSREMKKIQEECTKW